MQIIIDQRESIYLNIRQFTYIFLSVVILYLSAYRRIWRRVIYCFFYLQYSTRANVDHLKVTAVEDKIIFNLKDNISDILKMTIFALRLSSRKLTIGILNFIKHKIISLQVLLFYLRMSLTEHGTIENYSAFSVDTVVS